MTTFVQIHALTAYPAANLNRDDSGRPKTVTMGGVPRLRVSSQSLKRAWRTSDAFQQALDGHLGQRTKRLGDEVVLPHLLDRGMTRERAEAVAKAIADVFGKLEGDDKNPLHLRQLAFISPEERAAALALADRALAGEAVEKEKIPADAVLRRADTAADIAMFGRMLADDPRYNREAAVQVAHAITTHRVVVEDDYFTAVDDLKAEGDADDTGAGHVGVQEFGSGLFYLYACINRDLLRANLKGDTGLADTAEQALVRAMATVVPKGKINAFAHHTRASLVLVEHGHFQPRGLSTAFLKPVRGETIMSESIQALKAQRHAFDTAYGETPAHAVLDTTGVWDERSATVTSLEALLAFVKEGRR
ncbi:type I-E CRISPR-associated protein Cas7/Cse4/CasC [Pararhodospirillum photometricum]|uniref:CRISPR-associated protein, Cse4 family n=1 Tax=Pararhodospirillum photometricum DSM 122 TaxID=1150469 RepID=H6SKX4_PARPM|nr:type I-E CRISPR-associated protein Cas7/Cse4/CasC [Pararhodospirillum photometricum]CCG08639.1 CRISPR-associated protein, Cse4 family [Pararhodospirillum photometricum DSM 122]